MANRLQTFSFAWTALVLGALSATGCPSACEPNPIDPDKFLAALCDPYRITPASAPEGCAAYFARTGPILECGFNAPEIDESPGPTRSLIQSVCLASAERQATGAPNGWRVIPVNVLVAQRPATETTPAVPVRTTAEIARDFADLNAAFAPTQFRFVPGDPVFGGSAPLDATTAHLNDTTLFPSGGTTLVALYANTLADAGGNGLRGVARPRLGVIFSTTTMLVSTVAHEFGHAFALRHTHDCVVPASEFAAEQSRTGDEIADTPPDPGSSAWECRNAPAPSTGRGTSAGTCTVSATCNVTCTDGATPQGGNLMSYYGDCRARFSAGQNEAMLCAARRELRAFVACDTGFTECTTNDAQGALETCVDTRADSANCGGCGKVCAAGRSCKNSVCSAPSPPGDPKCDTNSDAYADCVRPCVADCSQQPHAIKLQCLQTCSKQCCAELTPH